jgi:hypothetical protein
MRINTKQINHTRSFPEGKIFSQEEEAVKVWYRCSDLYHFIKNKKPLWEHKEISLGKELQHLSERAVVVEGIAGTILFSFSLIDYQCSCSLTDSFALPLPECSEAEDLLWSVKRSVVPVLFTT